MSLKTRVSLGAVIALTLGGMAALLAETAPRGQAASQTAVKGASPALCGEGDIKEPGLQGDVPKGATARYNCGVKLVGQLPRGGNVQGAGTCAYVRARGTVYVIDVSDPARPVEVRSVPVKYASETMRTVVTSDRALLVSGSSVYDIKDCLNPVLLGDITWPPLAIGVSPPAGGGGGAGMLPHDLRINRAGTKVYGSMGLWEVDITNLQDPKSWKVTDYRCDIAAQVPGPWQEVHRQGQKAGINLCQDAANAKGANYRTGGSGMQTVLLWPTLSHSPDTNGDGTRVYVADQAGGTGGRVVGGQPRLRIVDLTQKPVKVIGEINGPGHGLDWFRAAGREYVLHSNEGGTGGIANMASTSDTCRPHPRPTALGWGFEVIVSDVTSPQRARNVSMLRIAINEPEFCQARKASERDPTLAYHLIDNPMDAKFAMANFGSAGLRVFDIRQPAKPTEVAYFNHGLPVHAGVGHYDAARKLIYASGGGAFWVLEVEPQVIARLGL